jgi:DNA-binding beta-propeller fold protein YncE
MSTTGSTPTPDPDPTTGPDPTIGPGPATGRVALRAARTASRRPCLEYAFTATPDPILVSTQDVPSRITLQVIVSPRGLDPVTVEQIQIEIPIGEDMAATLCGELPSVVYDPDPGASGNARWPWSFEVDSDTRAIIITPSQGSPGIIRPTRTTTAPTSPTTAPRADDGPLTFTIPDILVNTTVGTVDITVTETATVSDAAADTIVDTSHTLAKHRSDWPVISFTVSPAVLHNLDQEVTLTWTTKQEYRQHAAFELRVIDGTVEAHEFQDRYTAADGASGVRSGKIDQATTFELKALRPDPSGHLEAVGTTTATVPVNLPTILEHSYCLTSPSGRLVWLHWLAENALGCSVKLDNDIIDVNAPIDTLARGYLVNLADKPGEHVLTVTAFAEPEDATDERRFTPRLPSGPPITIPLNVALGTNDTPLTIALTRDGERALIGYAGPNEVAILDVRTRQVAPARIPLRNNAFGIACTPAPAVALVAHVITNEITVIDLNTTPPSVSASIALNATSQPTSIAITPDGKHALVTDRNTTQISVIDVDVSDAGQRTYTVRSAGIEVGAPTRNIAIAAEGKVAVAFARGADLQADGAAVILDIANMAQPAVRPGRLTFARGLGTVAVTPDGTSVLVSDLAGASILVADGAHPPAAPRRCPSPQVPTSIVAMPDGAHAVFGSAQNPFRPGGSHVYLLEIASGTIAPLTSGLHEEVDFGIATGVYTQDHERVPFVLVVTSTSPTSQDLALILI